MLVEVRASAGQCKSRAPDISPSAAALETAYRLHCNLMHPRNLLRIPTFHRSHQSTILYGQPRWFVCSQEPWLHIIRTRERLARHSITPVGSTFDSLNL